MTTCFYFIRSEAIEDIVNGSPYVFVIEINEARGLSSGTGGFMSIDLYYVTVVEDLKGEPVMGNEIVVVFFADTVFRGEQHIIAVEQVPNGSFYRFTSRDSLFRMDQLYEIMEILNNN